MHCQRAYLSSCMLGAAETLADKARPMLAEEVQSALAASGAPLAERYTHQHNMLLLEAALEKARRAHRPLIITSLGTPADDPSQIHMDPSVLSALDMQVCLACGVVSLTLD